MTAPSPAGPGPAAPPIRVLVCDDQMLIRTGYATIFAAQPDLDVVGEASDGQQAVDSARRLRPDVVVMDIRMPVLDGIEATRQLAGPGVTDPARVLVVTTFNVDEYVFDALRAGASGFLLKDSPPAEIATAIRRVAGGDPILSPAVTRRLMRRAVAQETTRERAQAQLSSLSPRELEVVTAVGAGLTNAEIGADLLMSVPTVKAHVTHILTKAGLGNRTQIALLAHDAGLA